MIHLKVGVEGRKLSTNPQAKGTVYIPAVPMELGIGDVAHL